MVLDAAMRGTVRLRGHSLLHATDNRPIQSLTQTRLHFQNIVAGFTEEDEAKLVDYKTDNTPRLKPGEGKGDRKGKGRMSAGDGSGGGDGVAGSSVHRGDKKRKSGSGS